MDTDLKFDSDLTIREYIAVGQIKGELGRKFEESDLFYHDEREFLTETAEGYANTYQGTFEFMVDMRTNFRRKGMLSPGMAKGVLNCIAAEWGRHQRLLEQRERARETAKTDHPVVQTDFTLPSGTYTLVKGSEHRTFKIKDIEVERYDKPEGTRMLAFMSGPDNERSFAGFAWIWPDGGLQIWGRFRNDSDLARDAETLMGIDKEGARGAMEAYAIASGRCSICGQKLTVPASLHRGIGPICAENLGW